MKSNFSNKLLKWNDLVNDRPMPWKGEKDPYKIWLSEIILQQTRVEQGWKYYEKFLRAFPDIFSLAHASQKKVYKLWEGLGYYNRCQHLMATAKKIVKDYAGIFPSTWEHLRQLKGIGPYTASAIGSFAFNLPLAVVDGNVKRVIARYFGIAAPLDDAAGKKLFDQLALSLLDKKKSALYNQAIMDLGAVICKPRQPLCDQCPHKADCVAFQEGLTEELPLRSKAPAKKIRWLYYYVVESEAGAWFIRKRSQNDIWRNLYEFVLWEPDQKITNRDLLAGGFLSQFLGRQKFEISALSQTYSQQLSHQTLSAQFIGVRIKKPGAALKGYRAVKKQNLHRYPFPRLIALYLQSSRLIES
jgi:A/G-specific adenine glycosylase